MKNKNQPLDRQQLLIDLYTQYLFGKITLGQLLSYLRKNVLGLTQEKYAAMVEPYRVCRRLFYLS